MTSDAHDCKSVTRHTLADIASDLEGARGHLASLMKVANHVLCDMGEDDGAAALLDSASSIQSLLHASNIYLNEMEKINNRLYEQAWALPMDDSSASLSSK